MEKANCKDCEIYCFMSGRDSPGCECKFYKRKKRTNRSNLAEMNNEQLAQWLVERVTDSPWCKPDAPIDPETKRCQIWDCEKCALEWLKQEAET